MVQAPSHLKRNLLIVAAIALIAVAVVVTVSSGGSRSTHGPAADSRTSAGVQRAAHGLIADTVAYLGISRRQLSADRRAGRSLAQIADATNGRSATGLIETLVGARKATLARAVASGTMTSAREAKALAKLQRSLTARVQRVPGARAGKATPSRT